MQDTPVRLRREDFGLKPSQAALLIVLSLALAISVNVLYEAVGQALTPPWLAAAVVHSGLALVVLLVLARRRQLATAIAVGGGLAYAPAAGVLLGALLLGATTRLFFGGAPASAWSIHDSQVAWVLWVPVVEELVFRAGIGAFFRRFASPAWAAWFSALVFALAHTHPTLSRFFAGEVGVPPGPFLLGLLCEALFIASGRILPAVALHMVCNATPLLFGVLDARWLEWLGFLYQ